jgi:hypothetical protein
MIFQLLCVFFASSAFGSRRFYFSSLPFCSCGCV